MSCGRRVLLGLHIGALFARLCLGAACDVLIELRPVGCNTGAAWNWKRVSDRAQSPHLQLCYQPRPSSSQPASVHACCVQACVPFRVSLAES